MPRRQPLATDLSSPTLKFNYTISLAFSLHCLPTIIKIMIQP
jgi:hypothetical protein